MISLNQFIKESVNDDDLGIRTNDYPKFFDTIIIHGVNVDRFGNPYSHFIDFYKIEKVLKTKIKSTLMSKIENSNGTFEPGEPRVTDFVPGHFIFKWSKLSEIYMPENTNYRVDYCKIYDSKKYYSLGKDFKINVK